MKNVLFLFSFMLMAFISYAQQIDVPKKLLKGIKVNTDEFSEKTTYTSRDCPTSIEIYGDSINMYIKLSCYSTVNPLKINSIYIIAGSFKTTIEKKDIIESEFQQRYMKRAASGNFGTSSYKAAEFDNRAAWLYEWRENVVKRTDLINAIVTNDLVKIKFDGINGSRIQELKSSDIKKIRAMFDLYNYLLKSK